MSYDIEIIRSARRTLALEITDDVRLVVRAPLDCPEAYIRSFVESKAGWIEKSMEKQRLRAGKRAPLSDAETAELTAQAKREIPPLVEKYASAMGLEPAGVKITKARKRFGSCSAKNSLCFSCRLMLYPREAIEYVVVHELAHIEYKNHGGSFYALIGSVLPDYRERDRLLK